MQDAAAAPSESQIAPAAESSGQTPGRSIVIFADGTGSAYSLQESNIWRLYNALVKGPGKQGPQQIARYIPGVGTSPNRILRLLDGATGYGVPSNVRELYRFLCWNCRKNDKIYLFGFSRGAFTVRALAGMISMQGLMPRDVPDKEKGINPATGETERRPVGSGEMKRNAAGAWRAYRTKTAPLVPEGGSIYNPRHWQMNPMISVVRAARDGIIWAKRTLMDQMQHVDVQKAQTPEIAPEKVEVQLMGVYDTVEAYGIPFDELGHVVNWLVWPFQFRNRRCSSIVKEVRHALALDDERLTFHPIRFDLRERTDKSAIPNTKEIWFAGMHSDVGGGYPDNAVALDALVWMAEEATAVGLSFEDAQLRRWSDGRYPQALIHDSRAGLASFYRYSPRHTNHPEANGALPVLHGAALDKIRHGANGYVPLILPEAFEGLNGKGKPEPVPIRRDREAHGRLSKVILWRKGTNLLTIGLLLVLVAKLYWSLYSACTGAKGEWCAVKAPFGLLVDTGWTWRDFLTGYWPSILILLGGVWAVHLVNQTMADRIKDHSRGLWSWVD